VNLVHVNFMKRVARWALGVAIAATPGLASAQQLPAGVCDFDIADDLGRHTYGTPCT